MWHSFNQIGWLKSIPLNDMMRKKIAKILWVTYLSLIALVILAVFCVERGWIGYMPPIAELQSPISK